MIVAGDPEGCAALAGVLQRAATGTSSTGTALQAAKATTASWKGTGATAWEEVVDRQTSAVDDLSAALSATGRALSTFAADLAAAQQLAARARALAAGACLSLSPTGHVPPVDVPTGPHTTPEAAAAAAHAARLAEVRNEVLALCAAARQAEHEAHERLLGQLRGVSAPSSAPKPRGGLKVDGPVLTWPGWNDWVDLSHGLVMAPGEEAARRALAAAERGAAARRLKDGIRALPRAEQAAARRAWRAELRAFREARADAGRWAAHAERLRPVTRWVGWAGRPVASVPVLRNVPVLSVPLAGAGYVMDVQDGMDRRTAGAKAVLGTAAGIATTTALVGGAVASAPLLVGVAAGAVVGYGVGKLVEHWGDDVVEGVGDLADGAGDAVSSVWGKVFG